MSAPPAVRIPSPDEVLALKRAEEQVVLALKQLGIHATATTPGPAYQSQLRAARRHVARLHRLLQTLSQAPARTRTARRPAIARVREFPSARAPRRIH